MATQVTALSSIAMIKQPDSNGGLTFDTVRSFAASGGGSTTTIVSTGLAASTDSNDDFVGWVVECASATNTQNQNLRRRITAVNDGTSTFTTDAFPAATSSGDTFLLMKPPIALCVADSAAAAVSNFIPARDRDEADDFWNGIAAVGGPYIEVVAADNVPTTNHRLIADFSNATQTVHISTNLSGAVAVGDYFEIWKYPEILGGGMFDCTVQMVERPVATGSYGKLGARNGDRASAGTLDFAFRGPGASRKGSVAEIDEVVSCVMDSTASGGDSTVDSGGSTTSVPYTVGNHSANTLGLSSEGYGAMVTADSGSAYTVTPAMGAASATSSTFYGMTTYTLSDGINGALSFKQWRGKDILEYIYGAVPNISIAAAKDDFIKFSCTFTGADFIRVGASGTALSRSITPKLPTVDPKKCGNGRVVIDGTSMKCRSFGLDFGFDLQNKVNLTAPNNTDGLELVGDNPNGTIEVYNGSTERKALDDFLAGKEVEMLVQFNSNPGYPGVLLVYAYRIRYTGSTLADDAGQVTISLPFSVIYDPTSAVPRLAMGIC